MASDAEGHPARVLATLLGAELRFGILGLRLFIACVGIAAAMLGLVWMLGSGLSDAMRDNARRILGGDVAVTVVNAPMEAGTVAALERIGRVSRVAELRSTAIADGDVDARRLTIELKAVDDGYPLYGSVALARHDGLRAALAPGDGLPGAVVEPTLLSRLGLEIGDTIRIGEARFEITDRLLREPDRLSAGSFLVGPRVIIARDRLAETGLAGRGSLIEYRSRVRYPEGVPEAAASRAVEAAEPERGWEIQRPDDAAERVRRVAGRTTTFLGVAGLVAFAVGLAGSWAAVSMWIGRRRRTVALYRLSGATTATVVALHAAIIAAAGVIGLALGLGAATLAAVRLLQGLTAELHLLWHPGDLWWTAGQVAGTLALGLLSALFVGLSSIGRLPPARAIRDDATDTGLAPRDVVVAAGILTVALGLAVAGLPDPGLAAVAAAGLLGVAAVLAALGAVVAARVRRVRPRGFIAMVVQQGLAVPHSVALRTLALGIGIAGITAVVGVQHSLQRAFETQIPDRAPDLVLLDVQPGQVGRIRDRVARSPGLGGLQASPFMRARLLGVNDRPVEEALVRPDKAWVIEGDRSFSWTAEPTDATLLAGGWWPPDHAGEPLISAEEDVMEAFGLTPGDRLTYSVLGRVFTSEVANLRKERHRTLRPEFLLVASPEPFRHAPHGWIVSLQGGDAAVLEDLMGELARTAPNITVIDVRRIVRDVREVIDGAILGTLLITAVLLLIGALSLAATIAADVDARRREAVALTVIGASRREIAAARIAEAAGIGLVAALVGGLAGLGGSWWLADEALHVDWAPGWLAVVLPLALGVMAAVAGGIAGGLGAAPRRRGALARQLSE